MKISVILLTMTLFGNALPAQGAFITTLFNTGVDSSGMQLPDGTIGDPHYSLIQAPPGSTSEILVRTTVGVYPVGTHWFAGDTRSTWIGPNNNYFLIGPRGYYTYRTTFDLTGFNLATTKITGGWSTDNGGTDILINGIRLGYTTLPLQYGGFSPFTITSGFVAGLNTLDFELFEDGSSPTGLRVDMTGYDSQSSVPEPTSLAAWGLLCASGIVYRFRRRTTAIR